MWTYFTHPCNAPADPEIPQRDPIENQMEGNLLHSKAFFGGIPDDLFTGAFASLASILGQSTQCTLRPLIQPPCGVMGI